MVDLVSLKGLRDLLRFPFQGSGWQKRFFLGSGLLLANFIIPILPSLLVGGYLLRLLRKTAAGDAPKLPEWEDWGQLLLDGLKVGAVGLVYLLPGWLVMMAGFAVYTLGSYLPLIAAGLRGSESDLPSTFIFSMLGSMVVLFLSMAVGFILSILGTIPLPAALLRLADSGKLSAAFSLRRIWRSVQEDRWGYLAGWILMLGLFAISYLVFAIFYFSLILCLPGYLLLFPLMFYTMAVGAAAFGSFQRENKVQS